MRRPSPPHAILFAPLVALMAFALSGASPAIAMKHPGMDCATRCASTPEVPAPTPVHACSHCRSGGHVTSVDSAVDSLGSFETLVSPTDGGSLSAVIGADCEEACELRESPSGPGGDAPLTPAPPSPPSPRALLAETSESPSPPVTLRREIDALRCFHTLSVAQPDPPPEA